MLNAPISVVKNPDLHLMAQIEDRETFAKLAEQNRIENIYEMVRKHLQIKMVDMNLNAEKEKNGGGGKLPKIRQRTEKEEEEWDNLFKSSLQIKLDQSKKKINALLKSMDENNDQLQHEVEETREEYFKLENQKKTIEAGLYVPCQDALELLTQLDEIDTSFVAEQSMEEEPEFSMNFHADKIRRKQMLKKRKIKEVTRQLKDFINEQTVKDEQVDIKLTRLRKEVNQKDIELIKERQRHSETLQILEMERAKAQ